jgi:uncharacterized protein (TIGR03067 family)
MAAALSDYGMERILMKKANILIVTLAVVVVGLAGCSKSNGPKADSAAIQGNWEGKEDPAKPSESLVLSGNTLEFHGSNPQEWYKGTFVLHEDANPKQMIITITDCPFPKYVGKVANAIYRVENGTLTIAGNEPGKPNMPTGFDDQGARVIAFRASPSNM